MTKKGPLTAAGLRRTAAYREQRKELTDILKARGLTALIYQDMVDQYMGYWVEIRLAQAEIDGKGINVLDERRGSLMANPACATKRNMTTAMLKIYSSLGFEAEAKRAALVGGEEEDDEL